MTDQSGQGGYGNDQYGSGQDPNQQYGAQSYGSASEQGYQAPDAQSYGSAQDPNQDYGTQSYGSAADQSGYGAQSYGSAADQGGYGAQSYGSASDPNSGAQSYGSAGDQGGYGAQSYGSAPDPNYGGGQSYGSAPDPNYGGAQSYGSTPDAGAYGGADPYAGQQAYGDPAAYSGGYGQAAYGQAGGAVQVPGVNAPLATIGSRAVARILDSVLVGIVLSIISFAAIIPAMSTADSSGAVSGLGIGMMYAVLGIAMVVGIAYEVVLIALKGQTVGKMIMGVKVVNQQTGQVPGWGGSIIRYIIPAVASFICSILQLVVYLSPLFDNSGKVQGWHDKAASTLVISTK